MRLGHTFYIVGALVVAVGLTMLVPLLYSLWYNDPSALPLAQSLLITLLVGGVLLVGCRGSRKQPMSHRDGMAITAISWFLAGVMGGLPFVLAGTFGDPTSLAAWTDGIFESISGFTTTGSSVMTNIEATPLGLLLWRSLTHWLGGMGIIVLSLAILPFLGVGGMQLYKAEVPGPVPDKLTPRIKDTAMVLWKVYVLISVVEVILLMFGGMDLYEATCHTFGTMATGGFSTKNTSVAFYDSWYIDAVITFFMFVAGANFALHFQVLRGKPLTLLRDSEFKFYTSVVVLCTLATTFSIWGSSYESFWQALRYASFQVVSICTTTGFATADYEIWTPLPQALLLCLMFLGGSAGSTSGGMKCMRIMLLMKHAYLELYRLIHPRAVRQIKLGGKTVPTDVMSSVWAFFMIFMGLFIISSLALTLLGLDIVTAFSAVIACIGNIGPGLGGVGPTDNFAQIPLLGKWILILCMLLGRLEIYTVIILFVPEFWRK